MKICACEWKSVCGDDLSFAEIEKLGEVSYYGKPSPEELPAVIGDSEVLLCSKVSVTPALLDSCPNLKYIGVMATGYNNIDLAACRERGVTVTNIPDYSSSAVAQMTMTFILALATSLEAYTASTARGDWTRSELFCYYPYPLTELEGKILGLVGMGSIGEKVARLAEAFGMKVIYHTRRKKECGREHVSLDALFARSDFVSLHLPLSAETEKLISRESLAKMKKSAFLINTARGGLIDEQALRDALDGGVIAGFAGDVLTVEPQSSTCPLIGAKNCILTPHIAWAPKETRARLIGILRDNLAAWLNGKAQNAVNG
ncbi:MAG: D-2-hydroxyacid dehydrogenase [Ruminococcaceae bacterium]|nr:D-2-hydroxyacid dehydrogenase [Oscillospiraceae bacterium]